MPRPQRPDADNEENTDPMTQTHGRAKTHASRREAERKKGPPQRITVLTLLAAQLAGRAVNRRAGSPARPAIRNSLRVRVPAVAAAGAALAMTVALGAAHHGSLTKPAHVSTCCNAALRALRPAASDPTRPYSLQAIAERAVASPASSASARRLYTSSISGRRPGDEPVPPLARGGCDAVVTGGAQHRDIGGPPSGHARPGIHRRACQGSSPGRQAQQRRHNGGR